MFRSWSESSPESVGLRNCAVTSWPMQHCKRSCCGRLRALRRLDQENWVCFFLYSPSHVLVSKLHWLPVLSRIKFKISSLTYKLLNDLQPGYLSSLISPCTPVRSLRSSDMSLLTQTGTSINRPTCVQCMCPTALECPSPVNSKCDFSLLFQTVPQNSLLSNTDSILIPCDCPGLRFSCRWIFSYLFVDRSSLISLYLNWLHWTLACTKLCIINLLLLLLLLLYP